MAVGSARGGRQSRYFLIWTREWKAVEQFEVGLCPPLPPVNGMVWHFVRVGGRPAAGWKVGTWAGVSETRCRKDVQKWGKQARKSPLKMQRAKWSFVVEGRQGKLAATGDSGEGWPVQVPLATLPSSLSPKTSSAQMLMTRHCQQVRVKACLFSRQRRNDELQTSPTGTASFALWWPDSKVNRYTDTHTHIYTDWSHY